MAHDESPLSRYTSTQLRIADTFKEQQYWLSVYNYAQQYGGKYKGLTIQDIITQLLRIQEKLSSLQNNVLPAIERQEEWEQEQNKKMRDNPFQG